MAAGGGEEAEVEAANGAIPELTAEHFTVEEPDVPEPLPEEVRIHHTH